MNRIIFLLLLPTIMVARAWCYTFTADIGNGVMMTFYYISSHSTEVSVGDGQNACVSSSITNVAIPEDINGYRVTSINKYAFKNLSNLVSIEIPSSITFIQSNAFWNCTGLGSVTLPDGITTIRSSVFSGCNNLTSIKIPDYLEEIEASAFKNCTKLNSITIPESVMDIGESAFSGCVSLTSIEFPDGIASINKYVCSGCTSLTSVKIPNSVTYIGKDAFSGCTQLENVYIVDIGSWCNISFESTPMWYAQHLYVNGEELTEIILPDETHSIGNGAFYGLENLTNVVLSSNVTSIGDYAFYNCSHLSSINIPEKVTTIGNSAFSGCSSLTSISISNGLTSIGQSAFSNCSGLTSITLPNSLTSMGASAFRDCNSLVSVIITGEIDNIGSYTFYNCMNLKSVSIPNGPTSIGDQAFYGCVNLSSISIPHSVNTIGKQVFSGCNRITSVLIPNSVNTIGNDTFHGCDKIKSIVIEDGPGFLHLGRDYYYKNNKYTIGGQFCNCSLESIHIGRNLKAVTSPFKEQKSLTTATLGSFVTMLPDSLFWQCKQLETIDIPEGVETVPVCAFESSGLKTVNLNSGLKYIKERAFSGTDLRKIDIPSTVTSIGDYAFSTCHITSLIIPNNVTDIGQYAFSQCHLSEISLPNNLKRIRKSTFYACNYLEKVTIPSSVEEIEAYSFSRCSNLYEICSLIKEPFPIDQSVFANIPVMAILYVPYGKKAPYKNTGGWSKNVFKIEESIINNNDEILYEIEDDIHAYTAIFQVTNANHHMAQLGNNTSATFPDLYKNGNIIPQNVSGHVSIPAIIESLDGDQFDVVAIADDALYDINMQSCSIPKSIKSIGNAFGNNTNLRSLSVMWPNPSQVEISDQNFEGLPDNSILYVPAGTKERYQSLSPWNKFSKIIESSPIYVGEITAHHGSTVSTPICLKNDEEIAGVQFKLSLPAGVSIEENNGRLLALTTERSDGWTIIGRKTDDTANSYMFVAFSLTGQNLMGTEGAIMNIILNIDDETPTGSYEIIIDNINIATATYETQLPAESWGDLIIQDYIIGDVNGNGGIDIGDAVSIVNYLVGKESLNFVEKAADTNHNGQVDIGDAVTIVNFLVGKTSSLSPQSVKEWDENEPQ